MPRGKGEKRPADCGKVLWSWLLSHLHFDRWGAAPMRKVPAVVAFDRG
jgi:hypothetical protein